MSFACTRGEHMTCHAYLFPGQGSQVVGMGQTLWDAHGVARDTFAEADDVLGWALSRLCFTGPAEELTDTRNAQPGILVASIAAFRVLRAVQNDLPQPCFMAGHSLGEYSALVASGALGFADAVRLTRTRGEVMARAGEQHPGSMAAILKLDDEQVAALCAEAALATGDVVQVANYNAPGQVVISGGKAGIRAAADLAVAAGGRPRILAVSIAAHSALMQPAAREFAAAVNATPFTAPGTPVIGNIDAVALTSADAIRAELVAQLTSPVRWTASVGHMAQAGADLFVEIGPGSVLTGLVKRIAPDIATANLAEASDLAAILLPGGSR